MILDLEGENPRSSFEGRPPPSPSAMGPASKLCGHFCRDIGDGGVEDSWTGSASGEGFRSSSAGRTPSEVSAPVSVLFQGLIREVSSEGLIRDVVSRDRLQVLFAWYSPVGLFTWASESSCGRFRVPAGRMEFPTENLFRDGRLLFLAEAELDRGAIMMESERGNVILDMFDSKPKDRCSTQVFCQA